MKIASIIGRLFFVDMLYLLIPLKLRDNFEKHLGVLDDHGLIVCIHEKEGLYSFQNELIRKIVYLLSPRSNAAQVHDRCAEMLVNHHETDLRPSYGDISYHYYAGGLNRALAFKYSILASEYANSVGNFLDGVFYAERASKIIHGVSEQDALLRVVDTAIKVIEKSTRLVLRRLSFSGNNDNNYHHEAVARLRALKDYLKTPMDDSTVVTAGASNEAALFLVKNQSFPSSFGAASYAAENQATSVSCACQIC